MLTPHFLGNSNMKFSYVNPTQIQFGQGQIASLSTLIPTAQKVLVVYGGAPSKKMGSMIKS